jgi:hypothetical protein
MTKRAVNGTVWLSRIGKSRTIQTRVAGPTGDLILLIIVRTGTARRRNCVPASTEMTQTARI